MTPFFVIGKNRSGTKWLSNIIANHPDIACIQRQEEYGILDADIFIHMPRAFGDLEIDENYLGFLACFAQTDFFLLTGLDPSVLYKKRYDNYYDFFRHIMNLYAQKNGKAHWLQKANPRSIDSLYAHFTDAKFIITQRDMEATIRSTKGLHLTPEGRRVYKDDVNIWRLISSYVFDDKIEKQYKKKERVLMVRYEHLREQRELVTRKITAFLGLDFHEDMMKDKFTVNTSFKDAETRKKTLTGWETLLIHTLEPMLRLIPLRLYTLIKTIDERLFARLERQKIKFMPKSFDMVKAARGWK